MRAARISESELASALRKSSVPTLAEARLVVLETDGTLSVLAGDPDRFVGGGVTHG
jgi:uncharacterized membrane protein YcaP (DUF421 family)